MATIKSYTDLEQSKKLAEILPLESADMYYPWYIEDDGDTIESGHRITTPRIGNFTTHKINKMILPCWSLAALMKLLPSEFTTENKFGKYKYEIKIRKYKLADNVDIHQIAYGNYKFYEDGSHSWKDMINTGQKEELLDAAFDMVCWLKENGNI